jgi:hypothetical protein
MTTSASLLSSFNPLHPNDATRSEGESELQASGCYVILFNMGHRLGELLLLVNLKKPNDNC